MHALVAELEGQPRTTQVHRFRARALLALSSAEFELSGAQAAMVRVGQASQVAEELDDLELRTLCQGQRGTLLGRSGDLSAALPELEQVNRQLKVLEPRDQAAALLSYGTLLLFLGKVSQAAERLAAAATVAGAAGLPREQFMAKCNEGYARYLAGDIPRALALLADAESEAADAAGSVVRLDRGRVLVEAGLLPEAHEVLTAARELARRTRQHQLLPEIELELARVLGLLGRPEEGVRLARAARDRFSRRATPLWVARAELVAGQLILGRRGSAGRVLRAAELLGERLEGTGDRLLLGEQHLLAAEAALRSGDHAAARRHVQLVQPLRDRLPLRAQLHLAHLRARLAVSAGQTGRALRVLDAASVRLVGSQTSAGSVDLRSALALHAVPLADLHVGLVADRGARAVFEASERWRAATVGEQPVRPSADPRRAGLLTQLREVREQLREAPAGPARTALQRREQQLQATVRSEAWADRKGPPEGAGSLDGMPGRPSYSLVRRLLAESDTDLVSLVPSGGRLLAVGIVGGRGRVTELGPMAQVTEVAQRLRSDLDAAGRHHLGPFQPAVWASLQASGAELGRLVLDQLLVGDRRLVIVPARALSAIPWALLPRLAGVPVVISASAREWAARSRLDPPSRPPVVGVVAGPGLDLADAEAEAVAGCWPGAQQHGANSATVANLRSLLGEADLVHVAAHGTHHQQNPMFASVRCSDGPLFVYDLEHTGVHARHVVLSVCEVGRAQVRPGDDPIGLAAGLLRLGATSVVAGVCRVPDDVACRTMAAYHRLLAQGVSADEALATAITQVGGLAAAFQVMGASWSAGLTTGP